MAAIITGLVPIIRTPVEYATDYKSRTLWFGCLCIQLVTLFVAQLPWARLAIDFSCNVTEHTVCLHACFNQHFDQPVVMAWNFVYILLVLSVLIMEVFSSHLVHVRRKKKSQQQTSVGMEAQAALKDERQDEAIYDAQMVLDFHKVKKALLFHLLSVGIRLAVEAWFLYILLFWNLPKLSTEPTVCRTEVCPQAHVCVVRGVSEKRMSIYSLACISLVVIISGILVCLYSIGHYVFHCKVPSIC